jgi:homogentisate phytyltransferase/homogentisate geranylgeranyltransferase
VQGPGDFGSQAAIGLLQALIPALLMNICIVGMNQIFDVDIDKVNKPYLPLASGDWSLNTGISVAVGTGLVAVLLGLYIGSPPLLATLVGSLLLGIAYSVDLPFLRWKKYPVLAMGCILCVR